MKRIELLKEHLSSVLGVRKVPLIYVLCKKVAVENIVNAPLPAIATSNLSYAAKYDSFHEEMIGCSSHDHPTYSADNKHVFTIINEALADTIYATSVKPHSRKKNGRAAYKSLVSHNCGNSKWETVSEVTERKVTRSEWNGQSNCFTLVKHIQNHCAAHNDMLRSSEFVNYEVPNDCTRVTSLLLSITSTDPRGVSAKTSILADGLSKRNDFELTADFLLKAAPDKNSASRAHNISSLKSNGGGGSDKNKRNRKRENNKFGKDSDICNRGPNTGVDLRYYTDAEYKKIKPAERKELYEWQQRNKANNIGSGPKQKESTHTITTLEQPIQKFSEKVESLKQKPVDNATASGSNNNHPALKKIKFSQRQGDNEE
eukprot:CAMPEP_0113318656 /NCGR_PEP_ID=MMETSP0010_2-20120614/13143_1 /TAXON_ID=216773 ORGANISM="Corethron hystrix, Strain 308" /NCGR_SAMPLE_ID=MMETSP0010_2 /ASSEMBLY_ACC=CAM_ASM_000155 /LENGTH=371 /DNA_ID=CAMNT_0000176013 /DNA_START=610 /DNA_END=1725 /DNA_ORIENTATION=- /assembly_acc=CAM_ASM_000155